MRERSHVVRRIAVAALSGALALTPAVARATEHRMPYEVKQSIGCLVAGTTGLVSAVAAGGWNVVNVIAGGVVVPQNRAVVYIGLVGVVFASFCAVGQALTPIYLYYAEPPDAPAPDRPGVSLRHTGRSSDVPMRVGYRAGLLAPTADAAAQRFDRLPATRHIAAPLPAAMPMRTQVSYAIAPALAG